MSLYVLHVTSIFFLFLDPDIVTNTLSSKGKGKGKAIPL